MNSQRDVVNVQNAAYDGDKQPQRKLSNISYSNSVYEEPSDYALQLDSAKRVPMDTSYQSLKTRKKQGAFEIEQRYTSQKSDRRADVEAAGQESLYEEFP